MNEFILALFQTNDKLKETTLLQVLNGKRTSSVMCYALFHDLLPVYGLLPRLSAAGWQVALRESLDASVIKRDAQGYLFRLQTSAHQLDQLPRHYLKYGRNEQTAWRIVQFLTQVASHYGRETKYIPLESSPFYTERIRQLVKKYAETLAEKVYDELTYLFRLLPQADADFLVQTLSGHQVIGENFYQVLPEKYTAYPWSELYPSSVLHTFFTHLSEQTDFILLEAVKPLFMENYNQSMLVTRKYVQTGYDFEAICQQRNLKAGTINDHLIEWALLDPHFPYERFIGNDGRQISWDKTYRELQSETGLSFLEIRLMQIQRKQVETCHNYNQL